MLQEKAMIKLNNLQRHPNYIKPLKKIISFLKVGSPAIWPKIKCRNTRINLIKVLMQHDACCFNHFYYFQGLETSPCLPVLLANPTASGGAGKASGAG